MKKKNNANSQFSFNSLIDAPEISEADLLAELNSLDDGTGNLKKMQISGKNPKNVSNELDNIDFAQNLENLGDIMKKVANLNVMTDDTGNETLDIDESDPDFLNELNNLGGDLGNLTFPNGSDNSTGSKVVVTEAALEKIKKLEEAANRISSRLEEYKNLGDSEKIQRFSSELQNTRVDIANLKSGRMTVEEVEKARLSRLQKSENSNRSEQSSSSDTKPISSSTGTSASHETAASKSNSSVADSVKVNSGHKINQTVDLLGQDLLNGQDNDIDVNDPSFLEELDNLSDLPLAKSMPVNNSTPLLEKNVKKAPVVPLTNASTSKSSNVESQKNRLLQFKQLDEALKGYYATTAAELNTLKKRLSSEKRIVGTKKYTEDSDRVKYLWNECERVKADLAKLVIFLKKGDPCPPWSMVVSQISKTLYNDDVPSDALEVSIVSFKNLTDASGREKLKSGDVWVHCCMPFSAEGPVDVNLGSFLPTGNSNSVAGSSDVRLSTTAVPIASDCTSGPEEAVLLRRLCALKRSSKPLLKCFERRGIIIDVEYKKRGIFSRLGSPVVVSRGFLPLEGLLVASELHVTVPLLPMEQGGSAILGDTVVGRRNSPFSGVNTTGIDGPGGSVDVSLRLNSPMRDSVVQLTEVKTPVVNWPVPAAIPSVPADKQVINAGQVAATATIAPSKPVSAAVTPVPSIPALQNLKNLYGIDLLAPTFDPVAPDFYRGCVQALGLEMESFSSILTSLETQFTAARDQKRVLTASTSTSSAGSGSTPVQTDQVGDESSFIEAAKRFEAAGARMTALQKSMELIINAKESGTLDFEKYVENLRTCKARDKEILTAIIQLNQFKTNNPSFKIHFDLLQAKELVRKRFDNINAELTMMEEMLAAGPPE